MITYLRQRQLRSPGHPVASRRRFSLSLLACVGTRANLKPLRIELTNGTNVGWFDNVRLTAEADGGGDPAEPLFALEIDAVGNDLMFSWPSQSGKVYDLLASTDLGDAAGTWEADSSSARRSPSAQHRRR